MLDTLTRPASRALGRLGTAGMLCRDDVAFTGIWDAVDPALPFGSPLAESGHPAVVRFGRMLPVPEVVPILHVLAIRVLEHDLVLVSVGRGPLGSRVPLPVRSLRGTTFSTLAPGMVPGLRARVVAEVHGPGPATLPELREADASALEVQVFRGGGGHFGRIRLGARLPLGD